jgi:hypothetical protein
MGRTCEIKFKIATAKAAFINTRAFSLAKWTYLRRKPVKCYIWSIAVYGVET